MFSNCGNLSKFEMDLPNLEEAKSMFSKCRGLKSFNGDLSKLKNGDTMFGYCDAIESFNANLSSLENGKWMFKYYNLEVFDLDISTVIDGTGMFSWSNKITTFNSDLSNLKEGYSFFNNCKKLTSFSSNLSSLESASNMFNNCKLDTASVLNIADTINSPTKKDEIDIGIANATPNDDEIAAFDTIASKNWTVYVNGSAYTPTSASSIMTLDELGNEVEQIIPFYAKPVPTTEELAEYVDSNGNYYNILGGQFIYGDDLSTYGMFTCEEDAAANMRLIKIEKRNQ